MYNPLKKLYGARKRTVRFPQLWDNHIVSQLYKNESIHNSKPIRDYKVYNDSVALYSEENNITYLYTIDGFDTVLTIGYRRTLRDRCAQGVRVNFIDNVQDHHIDWSDRATKNKFRSWDSVANANETVGGKDQYNFQAQMSRDNLTNNRSESLNYIADATINRNRALFQYRSLMLITGQRGKSFDESVERIEENMHRMGIIFNRVTDRIPAYMKTFSPFTTRVDYYAKQHSGSNIIPDEIVARTNSYSQGKVGIGTLYWGSDIMNQYPVLNEPKRNPTDSANYLIIGETGSGKSFMMKSLLLQLLAREDMTGTINDIEGDEYAALAYLIKSDEKVVILNMGEGSGMYFDPVEIHITGIKTLDDGMYKMAYDFTKAIFKTLTATTVGTEYSAQVEWTDALLTKAIDHTYLSHGVHEEDMSTWEKSKNLSLTDVYEQVLLEEEDSQEFIDAKKLVVAKLESFFGPNATQGMFSEDKRIDLEEIKDAKLVINSLGLQGKSPDNVDPVRMNLMQLYTAEVIHLRTIFSKASNLYSVIVFEEFNRYASLKGAKSLITSVTTGARKLGAITFIATNRPRDLLENDAFGVFDNFTDIAIGAIADEDVRQKLVDRISIPAMKKELDYITKFSKIRQNDGLIRDADATEIENNPYAKAFLVYLNRDEYAVTKVRLPKNIRESLLFKTGLNSTVQ